MLRYFRIGSIGVNRGLIFDTEFPKLQMLSCYRKWTHAQGGDDRRCIFAGHFDQHGKTRMSFHQGSDVTVFAAAKQVALPMTWNSAVFNLRRPFPNRDGIDDLT